MGIMEKRMEATIVYWGFSSYHSLLFALALRKPELPIRRNSSQPKPPPVAFKSKNQP